MTNVYLDIETSWTRQLAVVGFRSAETGLVRLIGRRISRNRLMQELPSVGRLFTYNGHSFDLPCIYDQLGIDLRRRFESIDLPWVCSHHRLNGGQKSIETHLGIQRHFSGLSGRDAVYFYERWKRGDEDALTNLLRYNAEDIAGLVAIRRHLSSLGAFKD